MHTSLLYLLGVEQKQLLVGHRPVDRAIGSGDVAVQRHSHLVDQLAHRDSFVVADRSHLVATCKDARRSTYSPSRPLVTREMWQVLKPASPITQQPTVVRRAL